MKKILLIGELNQTVSSVNKHLSTRFETQICLDKYELVKGMKKVFEPDMAVICLVGIGQLDNRILDYLVDEYAQMPVLLIGSAAECNYYQQYYEGAQFDCVIRPTTLSALLKKCLVMLSVSDSGEIQEYEPKKAVGRNDGEKKLILAVDDNGMLLRNVKSLLENDYDVAVATSGMMAIQKAKKQHPDLILLDYEMPEWDGKRTFEEIRDDEELKDIPVVFLTAVAEKSHILAVLKMLPSGYLLKPIDSQRLTDTIEKVLTETL